MSAQASHKGDLSWCLQAIARDVGITTSEDAIVAGLPATRQGLSPANFERAARRLGFGSRIVKSPVESLNTALFPAILLLNDRHACLIRARNGDGSLSVAFPELSGETTTCSIEDLRDKYTGMAIYCRPLSPTPTLSPSEDPADTRHWFWDVIRENRPVYRDVLIAALFINMLALVMPLFVMNVYDRVVPNFATETLWVLASGVIFALIIDLVLKTLRALFIDSAATRADIKLSGRIMAQALGLRMEMLPPSVGSFASSVQSFESARAFFGSMTLITLIDLPFAALFILIIAVINPWLIIPVLIGISLILLYAIAVQKRMHQLSESIWQAGANRNSLLIENLHSIETVKSFNAEPRAQAVWERLSIFLAERNATLRSLGSSVTNGALWVQHCVGVFIIIVGVYMIIDGQLSQGGLIAAYLLSSRIMAPISQTASLLTQYFQSANSLETLNELMGKRTERPLHKRWISRQHINGAVRFENVGFRYPNMDTDVLQNVSLHINAGEHIAILGRNGSGKSSIAKMICSLYEPTAGKISIDDVNLSQLDPAELRRHMGYVPQEVNLVSGTLYENITLGCPNIDTAQIRKAINICGLGTLINSHPDGLNLQVGERGQALSLGQRQSVALARAIVHEPSILVMDEPTSFLDNTLEEHIREQLKAYLRTKTLVLITHRGSLLDLVSRIIVIDQGRVVADGPKEDILKALKSGSIGRSS